MTPCVIADPGDLSGLDSGLSSPGAALPGAVTPDAPAAELGLPAHVKEHIVGGTSALGLGVFIERGTGFLANILAARFGGASTFGAYSLAISTANNISTYAAGGIGATAARFSGKYPQGTSGYSTLARSLAIVSLVSAALGAAGLWLGAGPIAHLLGKTSLTTLLRWAAVSAAGIILLECARGFFVGQRHLRALLLLSAISGFGLLSLLPAAAYNHNPIRMTLHSGSRHDLCRSDLPSARASARSARPVYRRPLASAGSDAARSLVVRLHPARWPGRVEPLRLVAYHAGRTQRHHARADELSSP